MAVSYSLSKAGLEVYTTTPVKDTKSKSTDSSDTTDVANNFQLQTGDTTKIDYIGELYSDSYEQDYTDISSNATISVPIKYLNYFYKGRKVSLKKQLHNGTLKWSDMDQVILGFITELTWTKDKVDLKISGMDKLLDKEKSFSFKKTKRSVIVKKIIEASGLKAKVDIGDLKDDVIDFTTASSSNSKDSSSGVKGGQGKEIDELVAKWCEGKTSDLEKAKAIHAGLRDDVGIRYRKYYDTEYHTAKNCLKHANSPGLNCGDTSILTVACMKSGGLKAYIALRCDSAHYFTVITIKGKKYYSDLTWSEGALSQRPWNEVWEGNTCIGSNKGSSIG